ncbi:hypothetical protein QJU89_05905 [Pasteurella skyensis]|uniref:Uncharacterized protein n=1 Tax=Phocoenobacter skyensis TaxID=97481 RepID=A0AAJ6N9B2_9PAST|nr:hypothetical protein [Pasteurella skyensis]MDP8162825.1 hypothetical protein [Pasteurella skyensis]MDP8172588.1 hypothetical protein [Pasteurella skyensis]MDP8179088.1 hypothetical protein [Pasteurella skyensis]MDP8183227.1 hypothetical protein [Pasteurella skyensis]MDP8189278.1 hypothetical protein [Pasteurella skyensis]
MAEQNKQKKITNSKSKPERKLKKVEHFTISYDASDEEYAEHKINVHNLIKIMQDMITLVERSDSLLNGKNKTVDIYIQALDSQQIVKQGSIQIPFAMEIFEYLIQAKDTVTSMNTVDVLKALGFAIPSSATAYGLFKGLLLTKGEPVIDVKTSDNSDTVDVLTENTKLTLNKNTATLMQDGLIRQAVKNLTVTPLIQKNSGIFKIIHNQELDNPDTQSTKVEETITLSIDPQQEIETLTKLSENIYPDPEEENKEVMIMITQLNFYSGKTGWKMKFDDKERAVELQDNEFITRINANQASFRKGDWLKVNLKIVKTFGVKNKTSYIITKVLEHLVENERKLTNKKDE